MKVRTMRKKSIRMSKGRESENYGRKQKRKWRGRKNRGGNESKKVGSRQWKKSTSSDGQEHYYYQNVSRDKKIGNRREGKIRPRKEIKKRGKKTANI